MKYATFTWSITIKVPSDFDPNSSEEVAEKRDAAWLDVQKSQGELTDFEDDGEPY
jgi:hypothetical protein